jgi:hypothetical protein
MKPGHGFVGVPRFLVLAAFTLMLLNALGMLHSLQPAFAETSQCSSTYEGPSGYPGFYFEAVYDSSAKEYGSYAALGPSSWTYDGDTKGHVILWGGVSISIDSQDIAGVEAGKLPNYNYSSTRYPYLEVNSPTTNFADYEFQSYPIIGTDANTAEVYATGIGAGGYYNYELRLYSLYYEVWFETSATMGLTGKGTVDTATESYYVNGTENCDLYNNYSASLAYSASYSDNPSWSSWTSGRVLINDAPYLITEQSVTDWQMALGS